MNSTYRPNRTNKDRQEARIALVKEHYGLMTEIMLSSREEDHAEKFVKETVLKALSFSNGSKANYQHIWAGLKRVHRNLNLTPAMTVPNREMVTPAEYAGKLVAMFGHELAHKVVDVALERDAKWVTLLADLDPLNWSHADYKKSERMFDEVRVEINKLTP